jgi:hypothetical protein
MATLPKVQQSHTIDDKKRTLKSNPVIHGYISSARKLSKITLISAKVNCQKP